MRTRFSIYNVETGVWDVYYLYNMVMFDERLDRQMDSGEVQTITENETPFDDFSMIKVTTIDSSRKSKTVYFIGTDTVSKRGEGYYIHTLELAEPSRLLMGILIDGKKVTQPLEGEKKTLNAVLLSLLKTFCLQTVEGAKLPPFILMLDKNLESLFNHVAPEFHWESQAQLWEVLCDIGDVVDCIPRLTINKDNNAYNVITFDRINDVTEEYEM